MQNTSTNQAPLCLSARACVTVQVSSETPIPQQCTAQVPACLPACLSHITGPVLPTTVNRPVLPGLPL